MKKIFLIIICVLIFLVGIIFIFQNNNKTNNAINSMEKSEMKKSINTFTIRFSSEPYDTEVKYDFVNKTKTIIHYTSGTWKHTDEIVEYNKFDKLFDYLYDTVLSNKENLSNNRGEMDTGAKPYFDMYIDFNTSEEVPSVNDNWYSYINAKTNLASLGLNGYKLPSYWKELLKILEIDKNILSEGTSYNFNKSEY